MMIVGSKDKIAVKIELVENGSNNNLYGKVQLYIASKKIGHFKEPINLGGFVSQFRRLANETVRFQNLDEKLDAEALTIIMENPDIAFDKSILSLGESFDDFEIRFYSIDKGVRILWRMVEEPFYKYPPDFDKSGGVILSKEEILHVVNLLEKEFGLN